MPNFRLQELRMASDFRVGNKLIPARLRPVPQHELTDQLDQLRGTGKYAGRIPLGHSTSAKDLALVFSGFKDGLPVWSPYYDSRKKKRPPPVKDEINWNHELTTVRRETEACMRQKDKFRGRLHQGKPRATLAWRSQEQAAQVQERVAKPSQPKTTAKPIQPVPRYMQPITRKPPPEDKKPTRRPRSAAFLSRARSPGSPHRNTVVLARAASARAVTLSSTLPAHATHCTRFPNRELHQHYVKQRKAVDAI